ncbi:SH3 domain-containing protein [Pantanalinema sp. GBBB05]|uniref:SH3 domain-containing protein n=1 Tax=Pantanalinema sp. GBBB05 TaxID=2604139 RepID=UPI001D864704|nr:SH3 domain-containing protein [Pantanalinema sp. GBBB05]
MKTSNLVHRVVAKMLHRPWTGLASLTIAAFSFSVMADQATAQNCNFDNYDQCGTYNRPVSFTGRQGDGFVETSSGIGLNIRSGPGLDYPIIGGATDGALLELTDQRVIADGYRWGKLSSPGWVATEYVAGGRVTETGYTNGCNTGDGTYDRPVYYTDCYGETAVNYPGTNGSVRNPGSTGSTGGAGGTSTPVQARSYVVVVPGNSPQLLSQVRRIVGGAYPDKARQGVFINAGSYVNYYEARAISDRLRAAKLDARVAYRRLTT